MDNRWIRGVVVTGAMLVQLAGNAATQAGAVEAGTPTAPGSSTSTSSSTSAPKPGEPGAVAEPAESGEPAPHLLPDFGGHREALDRNGMAYAITYTGEVLSNLHGGIDEGTTYGGLLRVDLDFDTAGLGLWEGGAFRAGALVPHGRSLTANYLGDLFTFSNIDAPSDPRLFELWYEHALVPEKLSLRIGQLAADEEFAGTDYGSLFINGTCGWPALIAVNVPSPAYPTATPGARLEWAIASGWTLRSGVYNGDPYPVDGDGIPLNTTGTRFDWRDVFGITELEYAWNRESESSGLPGRASVGGWFHTGAFLHQSEDELGTCFANPASLGEPCVLDGNGGGYAAFEQQLWREKGTDQGPGVFLRVGGAPPDRNPLEFYVEGGVVWIGLLPGRDEDSIGVAVVHAQMSREARELVRSAAIYAGSTDPLPDYERIVELAYTAKLRSGLSLQPVVGWVQHPGGAPGHDALVAGVRAVIDL